jgi:type I restriction enzyme S subunit
LDDDWVCSTGFCVLRCRSGITNPAFVFSHFFASGVNRQIEQLLTGSNYPAINSGDVKALQIPCPKYDEQTAIAEVLSDMDAEITALEQRREKTKALKQAMMQELLTGRIRLV